MFKTCFLELAPTDTSELPNGSPRTDSLPNGGVISWGRVVLWLCWLLSFEDRVQVSVGIGQGFSVVEFGGLIDRDLVVVWRERKRNSLRCFLWFLPGFIDQ